MNGNRIKMKYAIHSIIVVSVFCFNSCKDDFLLSNDPIQLYPLTVGNYWVYEYQEYDSLGPVLKPLNWVEEVDSDTVIDGQKYYSIRDLFSAFMGFKIYYINKSDGLYSSTGSANNIQRIYKYPVKYNELIFREYDTLKVVDVVENEETPSGKYFCIVYQKMTVNNSMYYYENIYISPGIGKIKVESGITRDKIKYIKSSVMQLVQYRIY